MRTQYPQMVGAGCPGVRSSLGFAQTLQNPPDPPSEIGDTFSFLLPEHLPRGLMISLGVKSPTNTCGGFLRPTEKRGKALGWRVSATVLQACTTCPVSWCLLTRHRGHKRVEKGSPKGFVCCNVSSTLWLRTRCMEIKRERLEKTRGLTTARTNSAVTLTPV